jgi:hypothetical protein
MKKFAFSVAALALGITASHGATLVPAGNGTFLTQGETDTFNLYVTGTPSVIQKVTITLTSAASQTGTVITNQDTGPASFTGSIVSNYSATILGFLAGGTVNLSDSQNSGTLNPSESFIYSLADNDSVVVEYTGALAQLFASAVPATGNIQATTLSSSFGVTTTPINTAYGVLGGTSSTSYTWDVVYTVPEPSAALLGGIGMLALLRRRR